MAKKKKTTKKKAKKKVAKKKTTKKKATKKKAAKKKSVKKKTTKKKATKKKAKKKVVKKKTSKKKATKKKAAKKKAVKKKTTKKKSTKKKATKKKAAKKKPVKKRATKKKTAKKNTVKKKSAPKVAKKQNSKEVPAPVANLKVYTSQVSIGSKIPEFKLPATGEQIVSLSGLEGKKTVIFFYPRDATPGCTIEAHDFTRLKNDFETKNTVVYGVSRDSMKSHEKFKLKQDYKIDLICDENEELCAIFGAIRLKNMYGKKVRGIDRSTFVIDEDGNLLKEWRTVKVPGHADEVLDYIKSI